eukprot:TRINITY_DN9285_c0_g1_i4.p1 TRINITY_DN9285_c0_g1~~TRINITY_DN9285_c0_g1_i4.p1  ORF type:complete len:481 (+),score=134.37 TRINITY_DN9285_c0_g1_i4:89-1444(+)
MLRSLVGSEMCIRDSSKDGPRSRRRDEISMDDENDIEEAETAAAPEAEGLSESRASESSQDEAMAYIAGHGSVPPPETVCRSGPRDRRKDEICVDDLDKESLDGAVGSCGPTTESPARNKSSEEDDNTPWYMKAKKGVLQLTKQLDPRRVTRSSREHSVGELVRCKMEGDADWVTGYVTSEDPLQVGGSSWDRVAPVEEGNTSPASSPNQVLNGFLGMFSGGDGETGGGETGSESPSSPKNPWYNSFKLDGLLNIFTVDEPQKSPRHHFNEGETLKVLAECKEGSDAEAPVESPLEIAASFLSDCSSVVLPGPKDKPTEGGERYDLVSCIKGPEFVNQHRVGFDAVYLRQHEFVPDGSGGLPSSGIPFGLGWKVESDCCVELDEFEQHREGDRLDRQVFMMEGFVPPKERAAFAQAKGVSKDEVNSAELATFKANRRRRASLAFVEEVDSF